MTSRTEVPTYQELMAQRTELTQEVAQWDKELLSLRRLRLPKHEFLERRDGIVVALTAARAKIVEIKSQLTELYPHGPRDGGKQFWRERSAALVETLDVILDDETASSSVTATVEAALRTHRRSMAPKGGGAQRPADPFLEATKP